ncbi:MAG TPA: peptide deformylase [Verrucomicrobiae bacterium]|nr:peptide deformylase [Verrucomicrobiae bacterium]
MVLPIIKYGHPALRQQGVRIEKITPPIKQLIDDLLETMYAAAGVGLAAQQVGHALQLTVIDVRGLKDRPSTIELNGKPVDVDGFMPLVLLNPSITPMADPVVGPEGCLSFPELYAEIARPESVHVAGMNEKGERIEFRCGGLLARAVQHEADHLHGILFIDRMSNEIKKELKPQLDQLQEASKEELRKKRKP